MLGAVRAERGSRGLQGWMETVRAVRDRYGLPGQDDEQVGRDSLGWGVVESSQVGTASGGG